MRSIAGGGAGASAGACAASGNSVAAAQYAGKHRKCRMGRLNRRQRRLFVLVFFGFFFIHFLLGRFLVEVFRFFNKGFGMKLPRKLFNCGDDARGRPVHSVTNHGVAAIGDGFQDAPARKSRQGFEARRSWFRMRGRKDEIVRLQTSGFFKADLRTVLLSITDGEGACIAERVGDESVLANGDERLVPYNKENTLCRRRRKTLPQSGKLMFHFGGDRRTDVWNAQEVGE